ncbi:hypothetical protein SAY87_009045 [Trapa incisa]|uniref:Uncharacterized protein n=1 Tax=Trapa incisa TaxID=236973 RepID=A0AAN7K140_9MYRT|nr:hypothetical protein SAY87_009045 [Trapa incisa]
MAFNGHEPKSTAHVQMIADPSINGSMEMVPSIRLKEDPFSLFCLIISLVIFLLPREPFIEEPELSDLHLRKLRLFDPLLISLSLPLWVSLFILWVRRRSSSVHLRLREMERRPSFCAVLLFFILLSSERLHGEERMEVLHDIDYRGPETHFSTSPPPSHSHQGSKWTQGTVSGEPSGNRKTLKANHKLPVKGHKCCFHNVPMIIRSFDNENSQSCIVKPFFDVVFIFKIVLLKAAKEVGPKEELGCYTFFLMLVYYVPKHMACREHKTSPRTTGEKDNDRQKLYCYDCGEYSIASVYSWLHGLISMDHIFPLPNDFDADKAVLTIHLALQDSIM